jgi:glutamine synthetase adenylyltransferase
MRGMKAAELYDTDFAQWAQQNAELLRSGRFSEADLEHIAEEIEDLGKRERQSLRNRLIRLIEHLLKWQFQPERRGGSWRRTIIVQRQAILDLLEENPSFRPTLSEVVEKAYIRAVNVVSEVTKASASDFPKRCPYTIPQLLDAKFLP